MFWDDPMRGIWDGWNVELAYHMHTRVEQLPEMKIERLIDASNVEKKVDDLSPIKLPRLACYTLINWFKQTNHVVLVIWDCAIAQAQASQRASQGRVQFQLRLSIQLSAAMFSSPSYVLTEEQRRMYASEQITNFRWISKMFATYSPHTLSDEDLAPENLYEELAEFGC